MSLALQFPGTTMTGLTLPSSRTPDDGVEGLVRASDMDLLDAGVVAQIRALRRATVDDAQIAAVDQRAERDLDQRAEIGVDRVHLADDDLVLVEELVEDVERADAGDVAGAEDERNLAGVRRPIDAGLILAQVLLGDARLHPHIRRQPSEEEAIVGRLREDARRDLAVGQSAHRTGDPRRATARDVGERVTVLAHVPDRRVDARAPLLAGQRRIGRETLGLHARGDPAVGNGVEVTHELGHELAALGGRDTNPGILVRLERLHGGVHRGLIGGGHAGGGGGILEGAWAGGGGHRRRPFRVVVVSALTRA
jgi:hypothetical protein